MFGFIATAAAAFIGTVLGGMYCNAVRNTQEQKDKTLADQTRQLYTLMKSLNSIKWTTSSPRGTSLTAADGKTLNKVMELTGQLITQNKAGLLIDITTMKHLSDKCIYLLGRYD